MNSVIAVLARPLIEAALSAFGHIIMDFFKTWQANADAKALGRAEAVIEASEVAFEIERQMGSVALPERDELLERLRRGDA